MIQIMTGEDVDITTASLAPYAEASLQSGGMTAADIALLKSILVGAK